MAYNTSNKYIKWEISAWETAPTQDQKNRNVSTVNVQVKAWRTNTGYTTDGYGQCTLTVDGSDKGYRYWSWNSGHALTYNSNTVLYDWSGEIGHNANGTKTLNISAWWSIGGSTSDRTSTVSASNTETISLTLTTIPRDFSRTPSISYSSKTETTIEYTWSTSETCDYISCGKLNDKSPTITGVPGTSGKISYSGLKAGTPYTCSGSFRRQDSQRSLTGTAAAVTTYTYPSVKEFPGDVTLNEKTKKVTFSLNNPRSLSITLNAKIGSKTYTTTTTGTTGTVSIDSDDAYTQFTASKSTTVTYSASGGGITGTTSASKTVNADGGYCGPSVKTAGFVWAAVHSSDIKKAFTNTGKMVQNKSSLNVSMSSLANIMSVQKSAQVSKATVTFGGKAAQQLTTSATSYSSSATFNYTSAQNATITVYDTRGFTNSATVSIPFIAYSKPVAAISATRAGGYGTSVTLNGSGTCSSLDNGNSITLIQYQVGSSTGTWTTLKSGASSGSVTLTLASDSSQTYYVRVQDKVGTYSDPVGFTVPIGQPTAFIDTNVNGVGVNCYPSGKGLYVDGTASVTKDVNFNNYKCSANGGNTNNYPWRRIMYYNVGTAQYKDSDNILEIRHTYNGGGYGKVKISCRTNGPGGSVDVSCRWLYRYNIPVDSIAIAEWGVTGDDVYYDVFYKSPGGWPRCKVYKEPNQLHLGTLVDSWEADNTTTSDRKTSYECYKDIASDAATQIRGKAYRTIVTGTDAASVSYAATAGSASSCTGNAKNVTEKKSLSSKSHSNWGTNNGYVPDMSFIAYWNGAYNASNNSNLTYCSGGTIENTTHTGRIGHYIDLYYSRHTQSFTAWTAGKVTNSVQNRINGDTLVHDNAGIKATRACKVLVIARISVYSSANDHILNIYHNNINVSGQYQTTPTGWGALNTAAIVSMNTNDHLYLYYTPGAGGNHEILDQTSLVAAVLNT